MSEEPPRLILASSSPRRRALLQELGLPFTVRPANVPEEPLPGELPSNLAKRLAQEKALKIAGEVRSEQSGRPGTVLVVGADTVVIDRGQVLGKPSGPDEATAMLRQLRNKPHEVITGVAVVNPATGQTEVTAEVTSVRLRSLSDAEIADYVASGDPFDKAGAYAIQNAVFHPVDEIAGCYSNVVGLPLCTLARLLDRFGTTTPSQRQSPNGPCQCATLAPD